MHKSGNAKNKQKDAMSRSLTCQAKQFKGIMAFNTKSDLFHGLYVLFAAAVTGGAVLLLGSDAWIVLIIVGFSFSAFGGFRLYQLNGTKNWNKTTGRIKFADIGEFSVAESAYSRRNYYYPEVAFSYVVNGRQFESVTITADIKSHWNDNKAAVEKIIARYAPGVTTTVYYNPRNAKEGVILPGLSRYRMSHYSAMIVGGILIACVGYGVAVYG